MPLDFAFSVHTDVGSSCLGVKINNSIKPLNTKLKNGDQVEILCGKKNNIQPEWIELSITGKARAFIKRYLHNIEYDDFKKLGKEILANEFKNEKIRYSEKSIRSILEKFNFSDIDELFIAVGCGNISASKIIISMFPEKKAIQGNEKIVLLNQVK